MLPLGGRGVVLPLWGSGGSWVGVGVKGWGKGDGGGNDSTEDQRAG